MVIRSGVCTLLMVFLCESSKAQTPAVADPVLVEPFTLPKLVEQSVPNYPRSAQQKGVEGWVQLNFMVDPSGRTYEIEVTDSSGDKAFRNAAVRAAKRYQYAPAQLNGLPIDAASNMKVTFQMYDSPKGASGRFLVRYKKFSKALSEGDLELAQTRLHELEALQVKWLYEDAYLNLARAELSERKEDYSQALKFLKRTWAYEDHGEYLPEASRPMVLKKLLLLQVRLNHLADALKTWHLLRPLLQPGEDRDKLDALAKSVWDAQNSDLPVPVEGLIEEGYTFHHRLVRSAFSLEQIDGAIAEAKLYCNKGFLGFPVQESVLYTVRKDYAGCTLALVGDPQTTFMLYER